MVIIIGAGPVGLACGIALKKRNIAFKIIDKGCLTNSIYHYPVNMTFFSTSDRLEIGDIPFISHNVKPTRREALEYYRRVTEHFDLPVNLYEKVSSISGDRGNFTVTTDKATYKAEKVIIASGFYSDPHRMDVPGEDLPKVKHYYDEPHPYAFQHVLVIGAGNSGVDVALETYRAGSKVTMVVRGSEIKKTVKYWVRPDIENRIKNDEIKAYFNTSVVRINEKTVTLRTPEGEKVIDNDFVLAMTGYEPDFSLLEDAGVKFHDDEARTPIYNEHTMESNKEGLYLAGVVCGGLNTSKWFIENSRYHGEVIAQHIAS
ncbi:MAG: YpdA family putative bacillithiol disulfide reductase [Bacteroidetes bacterium]|nr:YpdA family putative bacillithiol disulfide reductase [Bacteroidota bacterium]MCH8524031.1 YpdA family putative bacillithiol disulfide reductase [Balneolales bacterium]